MVQTRYANRLRSRRQEPEPKDVKIKSKWQYISETAKISNLKKLVYKNGAHKNVTEKKEQQEAPKMHLVSVTRSRPNCRKYKKDNDSPTVTLKGFDLLQGKWTSTTSLTSDLNLPSTNSTAATCESSTDKSWTITRKVLKKMKMLSLIQETKPELLAINWKYSDDASLAVYSDGDSDTLDNDELCPIKIRYDDNCKIKRKPSIPTCHIYPFIPIPARKHSKPLSPKKLLKIKRKAQYQQELDLDQANDDAKKSLRLNGSATRAKDLIVKEIFSIQEVFAK